MKRNHLFYLFIIPLFVTCTRDSDPHDADRLTSDNYVYEGDIYKQYLTNKLSLIQQQIDSLQAIIDNGQSDAKTQAELDKVLARQAASKMELDGILSLTAIVDIKLPKPPVPCPVNKSCFPSGLQYIVCSVALKNLKVAIYGDNGQLIANTADVPLRPLAGFENQLQYQTIKLVPGYSGDILIKVTRVEVHDEMINYETQGHISD